MKGEARGKHGGAARSRVAVGAAMALRGKKEKDGKESKNI